MSIWTREKQRSSSTSASAAAQLSLPFLPLTSIQKISPVPLFASREVLDYIRENVKLPEDLPLYEANPDGFYVDQMQVSPFPTSHDSVGSLGYRFTFLDKHNDEISVGVATDLGVYTP